MVYVLAAALTVTTWALDAEPEPAPEIEIVEVAEEAPPAYVEPWWAEPLAGCESTHRWHIYNPPYAGGLQMDATFWRRHGGLQYAPRPDLATREQQIAVAEVGLRVQGPAAWPVCSRRIGMR